MRDDRKALARLAGARGFDGRVQRQQVGLLGNLGDQLNNLADFPRGTFQRLYGTVGGIRLIHGFLGNSRRLLDLG